MKKEKRWNGGMLTREEKFFRDLKVTGKRKFEIIKVIRRQ
jgi:hypothetical protein